MLRVVQILDAIVLQCQQVLVLEEGADAISTDDLLQPGREQLVCARPIAREHTTPERFAKHSDIIIHAFFTLLKE
jgi:hypothetical protein